MQTSSPWYRGHVDLCTDSAAQNLEQVAPIMQPKERRTSYIKAVEACRMGFISSRKVAILTTALLTMAEDDR